MMGPHATADEIRALRRRELDPAAIVALTRHLAACESCAALARADADATSGSSLVDNAARITHPDLEEELFPYVDGKSSGERKEFIEEHLNDCARCREDFADARRERMRMMRPRRIVMWSAIAAAVAAAITPALVHREPAVHAPVPRAVRVVTPIHSPRRSDWEALVNDAIAKGRIVPPQSFASVRREPESLRGAATPENVKLVPAGVVVATTTPRFTWQSHGEPAVVSVYVGSNLAAQSATTTASEWTPDKPLERGAVHAWQVELKSKGERRLEPVPPDPPATFRVADEKSWKEIEEARRTRPDDHLLIGILLARAGLKQEALDELALSKDPKASELANSVRSW
jgi:hypothetical protein